MVFTHLLASMILFVLPVLANRRAVIALFPPREALVRMDVPRTPVHIAAVTEPGDRTYALGTAGGGGAGVGRVLPRSLS
jgi:hypothetical protein